MFLLLFPSVSQANVSTGTMLGDLMAVIGAKKGTWPDSTLTHAGSGIKFVVYNSLPGPANIIDITLGKPDPNFNYKQYYIDLGWPDDWTDEEYLAIAEENPECKPEGFFYFKV